MVELMLGDCLELLPQIPAGSIDLVVADPPYGTMHGGNYKIDWDVAIDPRRLFPLLDRIIRPNGKCVIFAQEPYTTQLIAGALPDLPFSYKAVWVKDTTGMALGCNNAMVSQYEEILIFQKKCRKHDFEKANELREYFRKVLEIAGGKREIMHRIGTKADHTTRVDSTQFSLCTRDTYAELVAAYHLDAQPWFMGYDRLKEIQEEAQRRNIEEMNRRYPSVFNLWQGRRQKSNVLMYRRERERMHQTQKPVGLCMDIVQTYSNRGDRVLDFTMGSGSTGVACIRCGRDFVGMEKDPEIFRGAAERIQAEQEQIRMEI